MITLCIPTLNRYDTLQRCIASAEMGTLVPDRYLIIDNGGRLESKVDRIEVVKFGHNIGVAASWNYFITHTPEVRIISNDDIEFKPDTIEKLVNGRKNGAITSIAKKENFNGWSLYIIDDSVIEKVGLFDETLSPNYAYYEDDDYNYRMDKFGIGHYGVPETDVNHVHSATIKAYSPEELEEHHKRFRIAQANYVKKWGGLPHRETYKEPYNGVLKV